MCIECFAAGAALGKSRKESELFDSIQCTRPLECGGNQSGRHAAPWVTLGGRKRRLRITPGPYAKEPHPRVVDLDVSILCGFDNASPDPAVGSVAIALVSAAEYPRDLPLITMSLGSQSVQVFAHLLRCKASEELG